MRFLCGAIEALWNNFYNTCFRNVSKDIKITVGIILLVASIIFFVLATKGKKKADFINNWFWFWISMITFICSVLYLSI